MSRINAVYLYASDLDRSIAFYRDLLGIPLERDATDPHWAEARLEGEIRFALHASGQSLRPRVPGTVGVNFEDADLEGTVERLRAAGTWCGPIEREDWGDSVEVFDADGYAIELYRPPASRRPAAG